MEKTGKGEQTFVTKKDVVCFLLRVFSKTGSPLFR